MYTKWQSPIRHLLILDGNKIWLELIHQTNIEILGSPEKVNASQNFPFPNMLSFYSRIKYLIRLDEGELEHARNRNYQNMQFILWMKPWEELEQLYSSVVGIESKSDGVFICTISLTYLYIILMIYFITMVLTHEVLKGNMSLYCSWLSLQIEW